MVVLYIFMVLLGAFPAGITIWRMRKAMKFKKNGIATDSIIRSITTQRIHRATFDIVHFEYTDRATGRIYPGKATTSQGKFKRGDRLEIYYLPHDPSKMTVSGGKYYIPMLVFCILLFLFVLFAVYKIDELANPK
jgi:hypothetical protein